MKITNRFIGILITILVVILLNFIWYNHEFPKELWSDRDRVILLGAAITWIAGVIGLVWFVVNLIDGDIDFEFTVPIPGTNTTKIAAIKKKINKLDKEIKLNKDRRHKYHCDRNFVDEAQQAEYAENYAHFDAIVNERIGQRHELLQQLHQLEE